MEKTQGRNNLLIPPLKTYSPEWESIDTVSTHVFVLFDDRKKKEKNCKDDIVLEYLC